MAISNLPHSHVVVVNTFKEYSQRQMANKFIYLFIRLKRRRNKKLKEKKKKKKNKRRKKQVLHSIADSLA